MFKCPWQCPSAPPISVLAACPLAHSLALSLANRHGHRRVIAVAVAVVDISGVSPAAIGQRKEGRHVSTRGRRPLPLRDLTLPARISRPLVGRSVGRLFRRPAGEARQSGVRIHSIQTSANSSMAVAGAGQEGGGAAEKSTANKTSGEHHPKVQQQQQQQNRRPTQQTQRQKRAVSTSSASAASTILAGSRVSADGQSKKSNLSSRNGIQSVAQN